MTTTSRTPFEPLVCVVGFHHARGPEVEKWFGNSDAAEQNDWSLLPFWALPDGSHTVEEEFSYFTLRYSGAEGQPASSLFGIACTRHVDADELSFRPDDVTRSSVQKAIVAIVDSPYLFSRIHEKLSAVTKTWFGQKDFRDVSLIEQFHDSIIRIAESDDRDEYFGLSLRELIHEYKYQTLVLFKSCLLQPKMLLFGSNCEKLCLLQFALVSLIPGLLRNLQDCADPALNSYEENMFTPTSLKTSERGSLLSYMGLPLQLFGKGGLFGPYTPLQELDVLADSGTASYLAGSTNSLLLDQKSKYSEVFVNIDENAIFIFPHALKTALSLSVSDRRFIDFLTQTVNETWDEENPSRPNTHGYTGSEDFIRLQFEEYLLALVSSVKYRMYVQKHGNDPKALLSETYGDPANDFGSAWIDAWMTTENFRVFNKFTDSHLFDIVEPRHPTAGALTMEDVHRRVAQQVTELHLDERFNTSKEVIGKHLATGQKKVSSAFNTLWADIEVMRETQRKRFEERRNAPETGEKSGLSSKFHNAPDLSHAQAQVQAASARAGAYLSSWGAWAAEKRKTGWNKSASSPSPSPTSPPAGTPESRPSVTTVSELDKQGNTANGNEEKSP